MLDVHHLENGDPRVSISCKASVAYNSSNFETVHADHLLIDNYDSETPLFISGVKRNYTVGDTMRLTCGYTGREDDVRLYWKINDAIVLPRFIVQYRQRNYIGLRMVVQARYLNAFNNVSIKCVAAKTFWRHRFKTTSMSSRTKNASIYLQFMILTLKFGIMTGY